MDFYWSNFNNAFPAKLIFSSLDNEVTYILNFFNNIPKRILARRLREAIDRYSIDRAKFTSTTEDDIENTIERISFVEFFQNYYDRDLTEDEKLKFRVLSVDLDRFVSVSS